MQNTTKKVLALLCGALITSILLLTGFTHVPVTGVPFDEAGWNTTMPTLVSFIAEVHNGEGQTVVGVYSPDHFALPVLQQPLNQAGYVSATENTITQFQLAKQFNSIGLLAHNYAAGKYYFQLEPGNQLYIIYGDGSFKLFEIASIAAYQALQPASPYSSFRNLTTGQILSAGDLFYATYGLENTVIMQTCIERDNEPSWGRLFLIANETDLDPVQTIPCETFQYSGICAW